MHYLIFSYKLLLMVLMGVSEIWVTHILMSNKTNPVFCPFLPVIITMIFFENCEMASIVNFMYVVQKCRVIYGGTAEHENGHVQFVHV